MKTLLLLSAHFGFEIGPEPRSNREHAMQRLMPAAVYRVEIWREAPYAPMLLMTIDEDITLDEFRHRYGPGRYIIRFVTTPKAPQYVRRLVAEAGD